MRQREGYVLLLVILIISMMSILVTRLVFKLTVFDRLSIVFLHREQAKLLAWSGVEMALTQLCAPVPKKASENFVTRTLFELRKVMTVCNRWQRVQLTDEIDGIDGTCAFYVACEGGKLNPNALYDREKQALVEHPSLIVLNTALTKRLSAWGRDLDFMKRLETVMRARTEPLYDVTELLADEQLKKLQPVLFMRPDRDFALTDLITVEREGMLLQPWVLSRSIATAFDLEPTGTITDDQWKMVSDALTKEPAGPAVWDKLYTVLYGEQRSTAIKELYSFFDQKFDLNQRFEADLFSVISYGSYSDVVVTLYAIVQRRRVIDEQGVEHVYGFVKRVYWVYDEHVTSTS